MQDNQNELQKREFNNKLVNRKKNTGGIEMNKIFEVFVDGQYIGSKNAVGNKDSEVQDIDKFLKSKGFTEHIISTQENEVNISTNPGYESTINNMRNALQEYLNLH